MPDRAYEHDVFISYSGEDSEAAQKVADTLRSLCAGGPPVKIFWDKWSVGPGDNFVDKINKGLSSARYYLLLLSPASVAAEWPTAERDAALLSDPSGRGGRVVPVLVRDCEIPPLLAIRHWIDMRDEAMFDTEMAELARRIDGGRVQGVRGGAGGAPVVRAAAAPFRLYSHEPDAVDEALYTNLYRAERIPTIWSAPTALPTRQSVRRDLGGGLPPFVVSGGKMYATSDIGAADSALGPAIDAGGAEEVDFGFWLESDDNKRTLTWLLNLHAHRLCRDMGLTYDKIGKRFYGEKSRVTSRKIRWLSHVKTGSRPLILPYATRDGIQFYRHRAVQLSFHVLGGEVFLKVSPGWTFTDDGSAVIEDHKRRTSLNTRIYAYGGNDDAFTEQRFWAWLMSKGGRIEMGGADNPLRIGLAPLKFASRAGIRGDRHRIIFEQGDPPRIALDDGSGSAGEGGGGR